ncbi:MAG: inositol-3-phosphate synthase [Thermoleophilia bacterium]|nr:inositol-3-phosphate synthase [Thermoleophilia bacterium]
MALESAVEIAPAKGKLGVLLPGMGAVGTTFIAGVLAVRRGLARPIGSLTQMGTIRIGKRTDDDVRLIKDYLPLAGLDDMVFGGWDVHRDNAYEAAVRAGVLEGPILAELKDELEAIAPMPAVFEQEYVRNLHGDNVKPDASKMEWAEALIADIERFKADNGCDRIVGVWCGSTEIYKQPVDVHRTLAAFEQGLRDSHPDIAPSQIYAYAFLKLGIPLANGAPNLMFDFPALMELARANNVAVTGKDFKTGQTLMKTILAPGLKARMLGVHGWYSTNILGNRDGEVLDDPDSFKSKEVSKLGVLDTIFEPERNPELYGDIHHVVRINYYPPRGDNKEGWDNIDIFGWLGYPMQIKIDFLCRDSILAAPIVLDLALLIDLAQRAGLSGVQEWLSFYWKSPQPVQDDVYPEHDLFIQQTKLKNTMRHLMGDEVITHLGAEYYD